MPCSSPAPGAFTRRALLAGATACSVVPAWAAKKAAARSAQPATDPAQVLPPAVKKVLQASGLPLASFGLMVRSVESQQDLVYLNAERPFMLASTAKLVTSLAALDLLGPAYRWRTQAYLAGELEGGILRGDLLILGGGDPQLSVADLKSWIQRMRSQGLKEIRGDIILDRSAFRLQDDDHNSTPEPGPDRPHHVRPDALTLAEGVLQVTVGPARRGLAYVDTVPALAGVKLINKVSMDGGCAAHAQWSDDKGQPELRVEGSWANSCGSRQLALVPPTDAKLFNRAVSVLWREAGGRLLGKVREGSLRAYQRDGLRLPLYRPDGESMFLWSSQASRPLPEVIRDINKTSNNLAARHLMLSLSPGFPVQAATMPSAQASVRKWLERQGLSPGDLELDNGSGLSRAERGKPSALVRLLCAAVNFKESRSFLESLPVAGVDGTLAHRMEKGFATGQAFLKTGSLLDARALAGYVRARSGKVYAVAALLNHPDAANGRPALDAVIEWLAKSG